MKTSKFGTSTGQTDAAYTTIKTGDRLRSKHTGLEFTVTQHGHLRTDGGHVEKKWNGDDYIVIGTATAKTHAHKAKEAAEKVAKAAPSEAVKTEDVQSPAVSAEEPQTAANETSSDLRSSPRKVANESRTVKSPEDLTEILAQRLPNLSDEYLQAWAQSIIDELRKRGWTVSAQKVVTIEL